MRSFARGIKAALSGKFGRESVRSALLFQEGNVERDGMAGGECSLKNGGFHSMIKISVNGSIYTLSAMEVSVIMVAGLELQRMTS